MEIYLKTGKKDGVSGLSGYSPLSLPSPPPVPLFVLSGVLIAFSLLCYEDLYLLLVHLPICWSSVACLLSLCPEIFISFWSFSHSFSSFSGFPVSSSPEFLIFYLFLWIWGQSLPIPFLYPEASPSFLPGSKHLPFWSFRCSPSVLCRPGNVCHFFHLGLKFLFPVACISRNLYFRLLTDLETLITVFYSGHGNPCPLLGLALSTSCSMFVFHSLFLPLLSAGWQGCRGWEGRKVGCTGLIS